MSETHYLENRDFSIYDAMETAELENILRQDIDAPAEEESDCELILYVMGVLADRRKKAGTVPGKTAQEAYESFLENYLPEPEEPETSQPEPKAPRRRYPVWVRKLTAAAAVVVLLLGALTATAWGKEMFDVVIIWTKETFSLGIAGETINSPSTDPAYDSLQKALLQHGEDPAIVPTWVPEGYALSDVFIDENPARKKIVAMYTNGEDCLKILVQVYLCDSPEQMEQSSIEAEVYFSGGNEYYLFENLEKANAAWINGNYECQITGHLSMEELKLMIDSIGKG